MIHTGAFSRSQPREWFKSPESCERHYLRVPIKEYISQPMLNPLKQLQIAETWVPGSRHASRIEPIIERLTGIIAHGWKKNPVTE